MSDANTTAQHYNSPIIKRLIADFELNVSIAADVDNFYTYVFNIDTALAAGLDIWGRIIGIDRLIVEPILPTYFAFAGAGANATGFNQAPFYKS